jgi:hypothetical protein
MTFTYTPSTSPDNITLIRYHISDTVEAYAIFTDDEITMVLAVEGTIPKAVVSLINAIIQRLSLEPDMTADWLTISWRRSSDAWLKMLDEKKTQLGVGVWHVSTTTMIPFRQDSLQGFLAGSTETYEPDYHDGRGTDYRDVADSANPPYGVDYSG